MGIYTVYRQFSQLCAFLQRIQILDLSHSSIHTHIENLQCSVTFDNVPNGVEMIINRIFGDSPQQMQSMRISGQTFTDLCDLLHSVLEFIHKEANVPILPYKNKGYKYN